MDKELFDNFEDILGDKRKPKYFPNKLQKFKPPLVGSSEFSYDEKEEEGQEKYEEEVVEVAPRASGKTIRRGPITYWRRASHTDVQSVKNLIEKSNNVMNDLFGEPDVPNLIEKSSFALLQFNDNEEIVSFISAFSYPDIPAVPAFEWYIWLDSTYVLKDASPRNCFFIHYMIWEREYYSDFLRLALETMFLEYTFLNYIIITKPPKIRVPSIVSENFIQVFPKDVKNFGFDSNSIQTILVCLRHSLLERLKIRLALVEDHDDLMPIVEQHTDRLKELYGEFCMAEIIEYPGTKDRKTLVCESKGYAVGFMNINKLVDLDLLNSQFDLAVFHGLKKPSEEDKTTETQIQEDEEEPVYLLDKIDPFLQLINSETIMKFLNWQPSLCISKEDLLSEKSSSDDIPKGYNELSTSMADLIQETLNLKLVPKFSAHALSESSEYLPKSALDTFVTDESHLVDNFSSKSSERSYVQSEQSLISLQHYNLPVYKGAPNAFCIEFYAMHKNFDDRHCQDFLEAAFEVFPDLEYCLLTIPSQAPAFPLLDFFTRVTPRPLKRFKQELYVCHKSSVMVTFMRVRRAVKSDIPEIQTLLTGIKNKECMYADIASSCFYEDSAYQGFVLICSNAIVGVAVLCNEYGMEYLAHHYHVSDLIDFDLHKIDYHAILKHLVLSPIFQPHARFFLRDIMRMADVTSLYRTRYEEAESNWNASSLITVLGQLIPVKPRFMVRYHKPSLGPNIPPPYFLHRDIPFSLYHINSRVCGLKKLTSNVNVVIVGASKTALSFLETLLFAPSSAYVTYSNITLVSPHGMGTELPSHPARDLIFPSKGKFNRFYKIQLCLKTYVNFVYGVMTKINRVDKYIMINNESILQYDYLILLCGRQFVMPIPYSMIGNVKECRRNHRPRCSLFKYLITQQPKEKKQDNPYPPNAFLINTDIDATNAFISLQYLMQMRKGFPENEKIIIYGHHICTYLCAQALLKYGIPAYMLAVVEPFPLGVRSISCFRDQKIDSAVLKTLKDLNIAHYKGYILFDWTFCENKQIKTITFHAQRRKITLQCLAMFPFDQKLVSDITFKAINEASLVYDGKLVINSSFQTNDSHIYAAGGLTKYQRKYYAKEKNHRDYSAAEVGKVLANIVRLKIDPTEEPTEEQISELVPTMVEPLTLFGVLPGDWNYFSVRRPGMFEDPETKATIKEFGDVLTTGDCQMSKGYGYFKLMLNDYGFVEGLVCYTKDAIDMENLQRLYGKHEKLLNDLLLRFDLGMIKDLYSYFREPWVYGLFHDRFKFVLKSNFKLFEDEIVEENKETVIDLVVRALKENNWKRLEPEVLEEIRKKFEESEIKDQIVENILDFLYYFDEPFPMYATPRILRVLLHDASTSLLHKPNNRVVSSGINVIDLNVCKLTHLGTEYTGNLSKTETNVTCQNWDIVTGKEFKLIVDKVFSDGSRMLEKNFCRNPSKNPEGPWCYTKKQKLIYDTCNVPLCKSPGLSAPENEKSAMTCDGFAKIETFNFSECRVTGTGIEYTGAVQKSSTGKECRKWNDLRKHITNHKEAFFKDKFFADGSATQAGRNCRNPDGNQSGPWCYVKADDSRTHVKELCDVPFCYDLGTIMYSEGSVSGQYFFFSSINDSRSLNISFRLWNPSDWLQGQVFLYLSAYDIAGNKEDMKRWSSGVEVKLNTSYTEILFKDEATLKKTPVKLTGAKWANLEISWENAGNARKCIRVVDKSRPKSIAISDILIPDTVFEIKSFKFFSLSGSPTIWNIPTNNEECLVHTVSRINFTRFWLIKKTILGKHIEFFVRAKQDAILMLRSAPMVESNQVQVSIGNEDKIKIFIFSKEKESLQLTEAPSPNILNFWKWGYFKITIIKDKLQLFLVRKESTKLLIKTTHEDIEKVMWVTFASPVVSYWTIYCDPRGVSDPPRASPPECIYDESESFNGTLSISKTGRHCIPWTDKSSLPEKYRNDDLFKPFGGRTFCQNFCRNLDKNPKGAFCIVRNFWNSSKFSLELCRPRSCTVEECKLAGTGNDYVGKLSKTRSKRECKAWNKVKDKVIDIMNFPDPTLQDAENFCRNPNKSATGSWCFTTDPEVPRDECLVKDCDKPLDCTILTSGFLKGTIMYILPRWRKRGLHFWLKAWNPDLYEGLVISMLSMDRTNEYYLLIGSEDNEKLHLYYRNTETEIMLLQKTLPHLVPTGKWAGYWLKSSFGKIELGYHGVANSFFEWTCGLSALCFEPMFINFGTMKNHWIGINFQCSECLIEEISIISGNKIYPFNLWKDEAAGSDLRLNLRGKGSAYITLILTPEVNDYLGIKISSDTQDIHIILYSQGGNSNVLASFQTDDTMSENEWSEYIVSFSEETLTLQKDGVQLLEWRSPFPLVFYWFAVSAVGVVTWSANCPVIDIDGEPRDGNWGKWSSWSCSVTCGKGQGRKERACNHPSPNVFGRGCEGLSVYEGPCNDFPCGQITPDTNNLIRQYLSSQYKSLEVYMSDRVVLYCNDWAISLITTEVSKVNVTWIHNGLPCPRTKFHMDENYSLVIPHAQEKHNGVYLCTAYQEPDVIPSKVVLEVVSVVVIKSKPTKKVLEGGSLNLKCNGMPLAYVYADLSQRWELNSTIFKDYGLGTLQMFPVFKLENISEAHAGVWTCVVTQEDFKFKWKTNWVYLKGKQTNPIKSAPNLWMHFMDVATTSLSKKVGNEKEAKIFLFVIIISLLGIITCITFSLFKCLKN